MQCLLSDHSEIKLGSIAGRSPNNWRLNNLLLNNTGLKKQKQNEKNNKPEKYLQNVQQRVNIFNIQRVVTLREKRQKEIDASQSNRSNGLYTCENA